MDSRKGDDRDGTCRLVRRCITMSADPSATSTSRQSPHPHTPVENEVEDVDALSTAATSSFPHPHTSVENEAEDKDAPSEVAASSRRRVRRAAADEWMSTSAMPGGPIDPSVLRGFKTHVAAKIWENSTFRGILTGHTRLHAGQRWNLDSFDRNGEAYKIIELSGLDRMKEYTFETPYMALITAFVERWQPETNTFHMPFGEMTITLHDVHAILGLNINGPAVSGDDTFQDNALLNEIQRRTGNKSSAVLAGIKTACAKPHMSQQSIARGYTWYLLGTTLFPDKTQDSVPIKYLQLLHDLEGRVPQYAWGAATLAYLYHQLGMASRYGVRQISGCLTLLECWIYEYFPMYTRIPNPSWAPQIERVKRWRANNRYGTDHASANDLLNIRKQLDNTTADQIIWTPYGPPSHIPAASLYHGCLRFMDCVEAYMPGRVARQFGRVQDIPDPPFSFCKGTNLAAKGNSYKKVYGHQDEYWNQMAQHNYALGDLGEPARIAHQTTPQYTIWYANITHSRVHNPIHGNEDVYVGTMYTTPQHRLQSLRQEVLSLSQQANQDPLVPDYIRTGLRSIYQHAGMGGFPGVHPTPIQDWWGQPDRYPPHQYTQPVQRDWCSYSEHQNANQHNNPNDEDAE